MNGPPQWALNELGLPADASMSAAKAAFRERAKASHPDSPGGDEAAFKRVTAAWDAMVGMPTVMDGLTAGATKACDVAKLRASI